MERIELDELDRSGVRLRLRGSEARTLAAAAKYLEITWDGPELAHVRPAGHVGSVRLSDRLSIAVTTKIPISNVLGLASLAYRTLRLPSSPGATDLAVDRPVEWLAFLTALAIGNLVASGMRQGYVDVEDELPYVRGRVRFDGAILARPRPALVACEFADFRLDTPENQVLRAALERLRWMRLPDRVTRLVDHALEAFGEVRLVAVTPSLWMSVRITRLNQHYAAAVELARLVLDRLGVESGAGDVDSPAFFFPMEKVFEAAIANHVRTRFPGVRPQAVCRLKPPAGSLPLGFSYKPDIVLGDPARLILETKYARAVIAGRFGPSWRHGNVYQIAFYANALGCPGALLYVEDPQTGPIETVFEVGGREVAILTIDLLAPGLNGLDRLSEYVERRIGLAPRTSSD